MKQLVKRVPLAISGLMLALAAAGNLVESYGVFYKNVFGFLAAILLALLLAKTIQYPSVVKEELKNPLIASVFPTLTMGMMLLATYVRSLAPSFALIIWTLSVLGHLALMIKFTRDYIINLDMKNVFPSWFIVYVGIVVGSVTAPLFAAQTLGRVFFWMGFVSYLLLLPIIIKKIKMATIRDPALPTLAIFAAPLSLCLAGYINSFETKNIMILIGLVVFSQLNYVFVLSQLPRLLKSKFYPSFSGFTFPMVISAISIKLTNGFLVARGQSIPILRYMAALQEFIAISIVLYVLFKYIQFLILPLPDEIKVSI